MVITGLSKRYGEHQAVADVNLTLPERQVISFIGPNGAGKSTVLNILARLLRADRGSVLFKGREINAWKSAELATHLAILTQSSHIQSKITVRELIAFGRFPYSHGRLTPEDVHHIDQAMAFLELTDFQDRFLDELSGGQRQRALIAMTLAQDTEYILLDEPTNNLDIYHATHLMKTVRRLCDELGKTIIMVLHELNYAAFYSDAICAFKDGQVARFGSVSEVMQPDFLHEVYRVDFRITMIDGKPLSIYF